MASQLLNLSLPDNNKFIVVDEGIDALYSKNLIIAWLQVLRKKNIQNSIDILLFSNIKYALNKCFESSNMTNFHIHDYFSIDLDDKEVDVYQNLTDFVAQHSNSILILDCLGTLSLQIGPAMACKFVEKLSRNHKLEVFCIYRRDFYQVIPRIETLGNIYVKLKHSEKVCFGSNIYYDISVVQKKISGSINSWDEQIQQNIENFTIQSEKIIKNSSTNLNPIKINETLKPESSFRLEMNEREIKQRDSVALPYIKSGNQEKEFKILYTPDDFDDEDPDDDLDI